MKKRKLPVLMRDDLNLITWKQIQCHECGSTRVVVYEGKSDEYEYYDGGRMRIQQNYPMQINCRKCGTIIRQDGIT